jgi:hypothetical protein
VSELIAIIDLLNSDFNHMLQQINQEIIVKKRENESDSVILLKQHFVNFYLINTIQLKMLMSKGIFIRNDCRLIKEDLITYMRGVVKHFVNRYDSDCATKLQWNVQEVKDLEP